MSNHLISHFKNDFFNFFFFKKVKRTQLIVFNSLIKRNDSFFNFFYNYCLQKNNFIVLDDDYSSFYPIYRHMYGYRSLCVYKFFFFIEPKYFILKNWLYFFFKFCEFNKINLIFILDYDYYINFYKNILESNMSVSAIVPYSYIDDYLDYPLYSFNINILTKMFYSSYLLYIYSITFNKNAFLYKYNFLIKLNRIFFKK